MWPDEERVKAMSSKARKVRETTIISFTVDEVTKDKIDIQWLTTKKISKTRVVANKEDSVLC